MSCAIDTGVSLYWLIIAPLPAIYTACVLRCRRHYRVRIAIIQGKERCAPPAQPHTCVQEARAFTRLHDGRTRQKCAAGLTMQPNAGYGFIRHATRHAAPLPPAADTPPNLILFRYSNAWRRTMTAKQSRAETISSTFR